MAVVAMWLDESPDSYCWSLWAWKFNVILAWRFRESVDQEGVVSLL
jgi:hypothetical protein